MSEEVGGRMGTGVGRHMILIGDRIIIENERTDIGRSQGLQLGQRSFREEVPQGHEGAALDKKMEIRGIGCDPGWLSMDRIITT